MGEGVRCFYLDNEWRPNDAVDCDFFYSELVKELNIVQVCENNALSKNCISKDFRGGDIVYAEVQGGDDKEGALDYFQRGCPGFSDDTIKNKAVVYIVNSGFHIIPYFINAKNTRTGPLFLLDVNALKGPNKWGHDIFLLQFDKDKANDSVFKMIPAGHCRALDFGGYYTKPFMEYLYGLNAEL